MTAIDARRLLADAPGGPLPVLVWGEPGPEVPVVLAGHGGATGKDDPTFGRVCGRIAAEARCVVVAIDGPAHGERAPTGPDPETAFRTVRRSLLRPGLIEEMAADWRAALSARDAADGASTGPLGYYGISMGTMLGLPVCAELGTVRAAVFALGGLPIPGGLARMLANEGVAPEAVAIAADEDDADHRAEQMRSAARRLAGTDVLMVQMADDELFPLEGALEVFGLLDGPKRLATWPGRHTQMGREAIDLAAGFLRRSLRAPIADPIGVTAEPALW